MNKGELALKKMHPIGWLSIYCWFFSLMMFLISGGGFWAAITGFTIMKHWSHGLVYVGVFLVGVFTMAGGISVTISQIRGSIIFEYDKIVIAAAKQGPTILYDEIYDIRLLCANVTLQGKTPKFKFHTPGGSAPGLFYEVLLIDGSSKLIPLDILSVRQRKYVLDVINEKTGKSFSYKELSYNDRSIYSIFRKNKETFKPISKVIAFEYPSWIKEDMIDHTKSIYQNAEDILNQKYGCNNWHKGPTSEYSQVVKWIKNHVE